MTDVGTCCLISPYSNFVNPKTKDLDPEKYTGDDWHSLPKGSRNGRIGGVKFVLDLESFDYYFDGRVTSGFRIEFSDQRDTPLIKNAGYSISPGIIKQKKNYKDNLV